MYNSLRSILHIIDECDVVSFDMYDTLVFRAAPVFEYMSALLKVSDFAAKRIMAEKSCGSKKRGYTIYDIYESMPVVSPLLEIELEIQIAIRNNEMKEVYDYAKKKGKHIVLTSDMYLPKKILDRILSKIEIDVENTYVSCDHKKSKSEGDLYEVLKNDYPNMKILHIDDNSVCVKRAFEHKIVSYLYKCKVHEFKNKDHSFLYGIFERMANIYLHNSQIQDIPNYYIAAGVVFISTFQKLQELESNYDVFVFTDRDGYILYKLFKDAFSIPCVYANINRKIRELIKDKGLGAFSSYIETLHMPKNAHILIIDGYSNTGSCKSVMLKYFKNVDLLAISTSQPSVVINHYVFKEIGPVIENILTAPYPRISGCNKKIIRHSDTADDMELYKPFNKFAVDGEACFTDYYAYFDKFVLSLLENNDTLAKEINECIERVLETVPNDVIYKQRNDFI